MLKSANMKYPLTDRIIWLLMGVLLTACFNKLTGALLLDSSPHAATKVKIGSSNNNIRRKNDDGSNSNSKWDDILVLVGPLAQMYKQKTVATLQAGLSSNCTGIPRNPCRYQDIIPFVPLKSPLIWANSMEPGRETKTMVDPSLLGGNCVVYGIGISFDSTFEQTMSAYCEVHAFDCTIGVDTSSVTDTNFTFQTCSRRMWLVQIVTILP